MTSTLSAPSAETELTELRAAGLDLDMTRGKPCPRQLDLAADIFDAVDAESYRAADGTDCRNYGGLEGLPELRRLFADILAVPPETVVVGDNASLTLFFDALTHAVLRGVPGGNGPWGREGAVKLLCPVPGYDRHFHMCEYLGIGMVPVAMNDQGPDLEAVETAAADPTVKGIICVPRYSNPTGVTYASATVQALAGIETAAPDFRIFWDDAYAVHHLVDEPPCLAPILAACEAAGHADRPLLFTSTSKISLAGAGVSAFAAGEENLRQLLYFRSRKTIGPDKLNQLRHARVFPDLAAVDAHMKRHAEILRPKFAAVDAVLQDVLGDSDDIAWSRPQGGYFISLDTPPGCAREVVARCAAAGVRLTAAGATFPRGEDPADRNIRIAPTFPGLDELSTATRVLALTVLEVAAEKAG